VPFGSSRDLEIGVLPSVSFGYLPLGKNSALFIAYLPCIHDANLANRQSFAPRRDSLMTLYFANNNSSVNKDLG